MEVHVITPACSEPTAGRARWTVKLLANKAVELQTIPCFLKMKVAAVNKENIRQMVCTSVKPGSLVQTDGLNLYRYALGKEYIHESYPNGGSDSSVLKWSHIIISNLKAFLLGAFHRVGPEYPQLCLDEFSFRFNRRHHAHLLFDPLLDALSLPAILYRIDPK